MKVITAPKIPIEKVSQRLEQAEIAKEGEILLLIKRVGYADPTYAEGRSRLRVPWRHKGELIFTTKEVIFLGKKAYFRIPIAAIHTIQPFTVRIGVAGSVQVCELTYGQPQESVVFIGYEINYVAYALKGPSLRLIEILREWHAAYSTISY